jgi:hypothetical protein
VRFIIPELPYEQPVAKGVWRYEQDGTPTGAVEYWRLSAAKDGYHFLRVDLDARAAPSGRSYLFHAVLDESERFVRLKYRLWQANREVMGNVHLEQDALLITSGQGEDSGGSRFEEILTVPAPYKFWFPASTALGFLARSFFDDRATAVTLVVSDTDIDGFQLLPLVTTLEQIKPGIGSSQDAAQSPIRLFWEDQQRAIWLDSSGWPRRVARQDGLEAVETQLVHYQRINKPGEP